MKMIKVTNYDGYEFYVNTNYIESVGKTSTIIDSATIWLGDEAIEVKETPEQIVAMIHEAEGNK